jgi:asparagine synthase (glutamine-hydrolysing)
VRAPLLDVSVLEAAWELPDNMKLRWGSRKWLLKRIAARLVPRNVVYRPKMGFAMPLQQWFCAELGNVLSSLLQNSVAGREGWIDPARAIRELEDHRNRRRNNDTRLWLILWLELWFRVVVTQELDQSVDLASL